MSNTLENLFGIEEGSTPTFTFIPQSESTTSTDVIDNNTGEVITLDENSSIEDQEKAEKIEDIQLQSQYNTIYKQALNAYEQQAELAADVDPKFSARNAEVAAQFLTIALNATKDRTDAKFKRAKIKIAQGDMGTPKTLNNNLIMSRNELLKMLVNKE